MDRFYNRALHRGRDIVVKIGPRFDTVDCETLQYYLPTILRGPALVRSCIDLQRLVLNCGPVQSGEISPRAMQQAWTHLIRSMSKEMGTSEGVQIELIDVLEQSLRQDQLHRHGHRSRFPRTLDLVRCYSEISRCFHSNCLAAVISHFFAKHGSMVARNEHPRSLILWACAITNAGMTQAQKTSSMVELAKGRPGLPEEMLDRAPYMTTSGAHMALRILADIDERLLLEGDYGIPDRGRGRVRIPYRGLGRKYDHHLEPGLGWGEHNRERLLFDSPFGGRRHILNEFIDGEYGLEPRLGRRRLRRLHLNNDYLDDCFVDSDSFDSFDDSSDYEAGCRHGPRLGHHRRRSGLGLF